METVDPLVSYLFLHQTTLTYIHDYICIKSENPYFGVFSKVICCQGFLNKGPRNTIESFLKVNHQEETRNAVFTSI